MTDIVFENATPVLKTADYPTARSFYIGGLGFAVVEEGGDPPRFGIFRRDDALLFLDGWKGAPSPVPGAWEAYVHVKNLSRLAEEFTASGIALTRSIEDTVYGMREFEITDPDGNVICFGEDIAPG